MYYSFKQVAEQLMIMHEDSLKGNYESIEKLRRTGTQVNAVSRSRRVINRLHNVAAASFFLLKICGALICL